MAERVDASNRIGSGGYNYQQGFRQDMRTNGNYLQNNLITGNITGGKEFRGSVPYAVPDAFRGNVGSTLSSDFIRGSSGARMAVCRKINAQTTQSYFGSNYAAPPPRNYVPQGIGQGSYVPLNPSSMNRAAGDLRVGNINLAPTTVLPQPGQLLLPGPVDPNSGNNNLITASPLYGVRMWNPTERGAISSSSATTLVAEAPTRLIAGWTRSPSRKWLRTDRNERSNRPAARPDR